MRENKKSFDSRRKDSNTESTRGKRDNKTSSKRKPNTLIRLNKYISNSGICSRREADQHIKDGKVQVNDAIVREMGYKVRPTDVVKFKGNVIAGEEKTYILINKPKDYLSTTNDPHNRKTVLSLINNATQNRVYPVGRLDRNTTGLLLLTNDGDLTSLLTHPKYNIKKIYDVELNKNLDKEDMQKISGGIKLEDGLITVDAINYVTPNKKNRVGVELHSGRNRIVRRIFEHLGYKVQKLDRVYFAGLTKKNLKRGHWRYLTRKEINFLKMGKK